MAKKDNAAAAADDATVVLPAGEGGRRRFMPSRKLMILGGGGLLAAALVAGATWALWPQPEPPARTAKSSKAKDKAKAASRKASEPASAESADAAASAVVVAAEAATPAAPAAKTPTEAAAAAPTPAAAPAAPSADVPARPTAAAVAPTAPAPNAGTAAENSMDKLRRRLGETLGGSTRVEAGAPGELRLVAARTTPPPAGAAALDAAARRTPRADSADVSPRRAARRAAAHDGHAHWDYEGVGGPEEWAQLSPDFAACARGKRQSPIDIRDGIQVELEPVRFAYRPSAFRVVDNGHTVQVNVAGGNTIAVQGREYELQQFHFHRPSEEHVNGRRYDMVAHLVHKDAQGRIAVVAVLLDKGGAAQPIVQAVWNNLPLEKNDEVAASQPLDLERLLPEDRRYYTYMGSLTTPPCSEGVLWMVLKHPLPVSAEQVGVFARLYPMNARPLQPLHGRLIKESN